MNIHTSRKTNLSNQTTLLLRPLWHTLGCFVCFVGQLNKDPIQTPILQNNLQELQTMNLSTNKIIQNKLMISLYTNKETRK